MKRTLSECSRERLMWNAEWSGRSASIEFVEWSRDESLRMEWFFRG